ncbi:hypothetical protein ACT3CE_10300 [Marinifilum sp. RC60d5]|uniref:hypothetical protein n=1 Tax=Marinifilum sp. RC60d5 TaxID=3458414 RepID=UPI004036583B
MKNRNTKDAGENHIYPFILSNLFLFIALFFSLNSAPEVAILFYSLTLNLFIHWLVFYTYTKKKIAHFSRYYNNLVIGICCSAASIPIFLMLLPLVLNLAMSHLTLLLFSLILSFVVKYMLNFYYSWETKTEILMNKYRMSIELEREENFEIVKSHADLNRKKFTEYIEKSELFDDKIYKYLE